MSFRLKTILGIALIECVLLSLLVISSMYYLRSSNEQQFLSRGKTTAQLVATMTSDAVVAFDLATLDVLVEQALKNPDVVYLRVRHQNGKILSEGGNTEDLARKFSMDKTMADAETDGILDTSAKIIIAGKTLGQVELGLDIAAFKRVMASARRWMLLVAAMEICLVALFGYVLGSFLTRQLMALQDGARRVASGEFGHLIAVRGHDELADTAIRFNKMSKALKAYAEEAQTARELAEERQALAENMLTDAVESLREGVVILDGDQNVVHMNAAYEVFLTDEQKAEPNSVQKAILEDLYAPAVEKDDRPEAYDTQWTSALDDGRYILNSRVPMGSGGWVFVKTDVTQIYRAQERQRQLERELLQAQKLEALGTLAGGIAHEINTPIHYIGDNLRFMGRVSEKLVKLVDTHHDLAESTQKIVNLAELREQAKACCELYDDMDVNFLKEDMLDAVDQSIHGIEQVSRIVSAMKEFSHPSSKEKKPVDLNEAVQRATVVCRSEWKPVAKLHLDLEERLPSIMALEGELNQVILNLVVNAAHAIAAKNEKEGALIGDITVRTLHRDDTVEFSVQDTGCGVPEDIRHRIFEPFFTTKDVGKGTGQGLALCHDVVVNKHCGQIKVETELGIGSTFIVTLPIDSMHSDDSENF